MFWFTLQILIMAEAGTSQSCRSDQGMQPSFPRKVEGFPYIDQYLLPPRTCISGNVELETEWDLNLTILIRVVDITGVLIFGSLACPINKFYIFCHLRSMIRISSLNLQRFSQNEEGHFKIISLQCQNVMKTCHPQVII